MLQTDIDPIQGAGEAQLVQKVVAAVIRLVNEVGVFRQSLLEDGRMFTDIGCSVAATTA